MSRKTFLIVFTSAMLGAAVIAPDASLAQLPPPPLGALPRLPGGAPPGLPGGGLAGLRRPGGPGPRAADLPHPSDTGGGRPSLHSGQGDVFDRSGAYAYGHSGVYGHSSNYDYDRSAHAYGNRSWRQTGRVMACMSTAILTLVAATTPTSTTTGSAHIRAFRSAPKTECDGYVNARLDAWCDTKAFWDSCPSIQPSQPAS